MSHRNNGSRHNPGFVHAESPMLVGPIPEQQSAPEKPTLSSPPQAFYYHNHRGHRRGHSYGGPVSPTTSAFHHARLEARPSHPNTHHGTLPPHTQVTNAELLKGHRRALSGCMPMMGGMGAVAWSSLRELQSPSGLHAAVQGLRSRSPIEIPGEFQPSTGDGKKSFIRPMSPDHEPPRQSKPSSMDDVECGFGPCALPGYFNVLANIRVFVTILAILVTLQQAVASGYVNSVITTIELRFEIPSKYTGLVASAYEMGNVITVLFVSYLGAKRHIPRWIAVGVLVMVLGCVIFTLPHFLSPHPGSRTPALANDPSSSNSYQTARLTQLQNDLYSANTQNSSFSSPAALRDALNVSGIAAFDESAGVTTHLGKNGVCHSQNPPPPSKFISTGNEKHSSGASGGEEISESASDFPLVHREKLTTTRAGCEMEVTEDGSLKSLEPESYAHPLILFTLAQILLGVGGSPLFTLGITYVDDHVPKDSSSVFIGIVYAMGAFGPVLGFLIGAWLLTIPASWVSTPVPDAEFIGMWWGGFLIVGLLLFVACLPFFTFPRILQKTDSKEVEFNINESTEERSSEDTSDETYGQSIRDIPRSMFRLLSNPAYVITCLAGCMEMNIISGFVVFLPKYLETQFGLGKSEASVFTGGIAIPGAFFGILAGGYIMKRQQLTPSGAAKLVVIVNTVCLLGHACFFFLGCTNPKLAGATIPYPDSLNPLEYTPYNVNLTSFCNLDCNCDSSIDAQYVCAGGVTYFSPCHAGCLGNLTQCTCAGGGDVTLGVCPDSPCTTLLPFMIILFFMTATVAMMQMPLLMIVLRSVSEEERSFALGMQFVLFRLLGYIPSPIIFGNVIDSACLLWSIRRCSTLLPAVSGRCLRYDILDFRYKYVGMLTGFKLVAISLFIYNFFQLRRMELEDEKAEQDQLAAETEVLKDTANSIDSLDRMFEGGGDGDLLAIGFEEGEEVPYSISMTTKDAELKT